MAAADKILKGESCLFGQDQRQAGCAIQKGPRTVL
jgi:hypothetical protein